LSGSAAVQFTMFPPVLNFVPAGGFGGGLEGWPFSFSYTPGPVPQDPGPIVSYGADFVPGVGVGVEQSGTYVPQSVSLQNQSTSWSFVVGGGTDAYVRKRYSFPILGSQDALIGGTAPKGLTLLSTSNFSTPNCVVTSPQSYYSGGFSTFISADAHTACGLLCAVPQSRSSSGGSGGATYSLPAMVTQGSNTYYRNSSGLLSSTPGH
jgi:hypothetical protein